MSTTSGLTMIIFGIIQPTSRGSLMVEIHPLHYVIYHILITANDLMDVLVRQLNLLIRNNCGFSLNQNVLWI